MSTRQSRKSTPIPSTPQSTSSNRSRGRDGSESPISPARLSRLQEKTELQNLNDRLACYINKVKSLEIENNRLSVQVRTLEEVKYSEVHHIQTNYEEKLKNLRAIADYEANQKARLELEKARIAEENKELSSKFDSMSKDIAKLRAEVNDFERSHNDLTTKCNQLTSDNRKLKQENQELNKEKSRLRKQLDEKTKQLEEEILLRIRTQNTVQSLEERVQFAENLYQSTLSETSRIQRKLEISEVDAGQISQTEFQSQELEKLRAEFREELKFKREEISKMYDEKVTFLETELNKKSTLAQDALLGQKKYLEQIEELRRRLIVLEDRIRHYENLNHELETALHEEKSEYIANMDNANRINDKWATEYQDLMDVKISLDMELTAYKKLLEGEERRLNYTPNASRNNATSAGQDEDEYPEFRGGKRKRGDGYESSAFSSSEITVNKTSVGDVEISEISQEGVYVKIHNKGTKDLSVGTWQITRLAGEKSVTFKFHHTVKLASGETITVWSMDAQATHEPPLNIVMKTQKWPIADSMETVLYNNKNEEMAKVVQNKQKKIREVSHSNYGTATTTRTQVPQQNGVGDDKCCIM